VITEITVFCDGNHKGDKKTEWTFVHLGEGWVDKEQMVPTGPPRRHGWLDSNAPWGGMRHDYQCNLCRANRLICSPETLNSMLNGFATHGESRISLRLLVVLASSGRV
jgi:hypothetical protein